MGIVNGTGTNNNGSFYGGAVYAYDAKIELSNLNLTENTAVEGGALAAQRDDSDCRIITSKEGRGNGPIA